MPNGTTGNVVTHERREEICGDDSGNSRATSTCTPEAHRKRPSLLETRHRKYRLFLRRSSQRKRGEREPTPTPLCSSPAFLDKSIARLRADADGGDAAMDTTETAGTPYELLPPSATSYSIEQPQCRR